MHLAPVLAVLSALAAMPAQAAEASLAASNFDKPLAVKHVDLGPADTVPPQEKQVRCSYFPTFMAKEVDEREVGAAQLAILPPGAACQRDDLPGERVVDSKAWSGYFAGAHGAFAVFSADDGEHGGLGFAVVRASDAGVLYSAVADGKLTFATGADGATVLHFNAIHAGSCSVAVKGAACATAIGREIGIAAPDVAQCKRGYAEAKRRMAEDRCKENAPKDKGCVAKEIAGMPDWDSSPTVVSYKVEVALTPAVGAEHPSGGPIACWPAE
jgi:hypothetical protein